MNFIRRESEKVGETKKFKSIHIDLDKGIFELNGEKLDMVSELELKACGYNWNLTLQKEERYEAPISTKKKDQIQCQMPNRSGI